MKTINIKPKAIYVKFELNKTFAKDKKLFATLKRKAMKHAAATLAKEMLMNGYITSTEVLRHPYNDTVVFTIYCMPLKPDRKLP